MTVSFFKPSTVGVAKHKKGGGLAQFSLALGTTPDPGQANRSSATCPPEASPSGWNKALGSMAGNCSGFELLCVTVANGKATGEPLWLPATPRLSADGKAITLTAGGAAAASRVARGSSYAWAAWPLATLFAAVSGGDDDVGADNALGGPAAELGLPILPWRQSLTCTDGKVPGTPC